MSITRAIIQIAQTRSKNCGKDSSDKVLPPRTPGVGIFDSQRVAQAPFSSSECTLITLQLVSTLSQNATETPSSLLHCYRNSTDFGCLPRRIFGISSSLHPILSNQCSVLRDPAPSLLLVGNGGQNLHYPSPLV